MENELVIRNFRFIDSFNKITITFYKEPDKYVKNLQYILMQLVDAKNGSMGTIWNLIQNKINQIVMNNATHSYETSYKRHRKESMEYDSICIENLYKHLCATFQNLINKQIILGNKVYDDPMFIIYFGTIIYYFHRIMSLLTMNIHYFSANMITLINQFTGCSNFSGFVNSRTYDLFYNEKCGKFDKYEIGSRYVIINTKRDNKYKLCFVNLVSFDCMEPDLKYVQDYLSSD